MSIFTNPASDSQEKAQEYIRATVGLLDGLDPVEVLAETPAHIARLLDGLSDEELAEPEAPGKWSIREVLQHLADSELVFGYRIRRVLAEDRPRLEGYDQDLWAERLSYSEADVAESLEMFRALRAATLRILRGASEADLQRIGAHQERGDESLEHMLRMYAGHDIVHRRQIERIRAAHGTG
jgi:uncharacterized damage-inducible protein DinB